MNNNFYVKKPDKFFMVTFEDYQSQKQISYYNELIQLIEKEGYYIEKEGKYGDRYYWKFTKNIITESDKKQLDEETKKFLSIKRDEEYYQKMAERITGDITKWKIIEK